MKLIDSRRLTGPNLQLQSPAAIAEVEFDEGETADAVIGHWHDAVSRMLLAVGWSDATRFVRPFADGRGAAVGFSAPFDALYAATDVNDWAIEAAAAALGGPEPRSLDSAAARIRRAIASESRPELVRLDAAARAAGLPMLVDDDGVTVGLGVNSQTWALDAVPAPGDLDLRRLGTIPVVAVSGTNGKTTSARWLVRMFANAGLLAGNTSTDGIVVDGVEIEPGDCTGPGAARRLLRWPTLQAAVLETARGGLLRRGFVLEQCDAALITNVSNDHLGEYGIQTVDELASVKAVVGSCVEPEGRVVLGADSEALARRPWRFAAPKVWFGLTPDNPRIREHLDTGGEAWFVEDSAIVRAHRSRREAILGVDEIALTMGGVAVHNIANALGTAAVAVGLGLPMEAITAALRDFGKSPQDNPGRLERYELDGVLVLLDFAHNLDGLARQIDVVAALRRDRPGRLAVSFGMAGDRSDAMLADLAATIARMGPDHVIVRDEPGYMRGRRPGEVPAILRAAFERSGVDAAAIDEAPDGRTAIAMARRWARPGDAIAVFCHTDRAPMG